MGEPLDATAPSGFVKIVPNRYESTMSRTEVCRVLTWVVSIRDVLREFLPPIKTKDARTDFYTAYQRESSQYDHDYVRKYDDDLNTTLVFVSLSCLGFLSVVADWGRKAGLFSAVSSAFVIQVQSNLGPSYDEMNAAYMRYLIYSINNTAFQTPPDLPTWDGPSTEIVVAANLLYASLATSLLAAFVAMLGKQWVNRYTRNKGGSTAERCGDRQRKLNGLYRWRFHVLMESLPVALQLALLLLGCGLSQYTWTINQTVAGTIMGVTGFGLLFYIAIVIVGIISYECPFQTPLSLAFRAFGAHRAFSYLRAFFHARIDSISSFLIASRSRPAVRIGTNNLPRSLDIPPMERLFFSEGGLLKPDRMRFDRRRNLLDALCVSWTLDTITDPEVMEAALRQFMSIQWHAGVSPAASPHQLIALYRDCFDYRNTLLPGSRDRAYASGRALTQFYVQNLCVSRDILSDSDLPTDLPTFFTGDADTVSLSSILTGIARGNPFQGFYTLEDMSTNHLCWISDLSLCLNWVHWQQPLPSTIDPLSFAHQVITLDGTPKHVLFNCMLIIGMSLGLQVTVDDLFIADKACVIASISITLMLTVTPFM